MIPNERVVMLNTRTNMAGRKSALTVLLIRHAESVPPGTSGFDEYARPLTPKGMRDAE